jgi:hypothetical protein
MQTGPGRARREHHPPLASLCWPPLHSRARAAAGAGVPMPVLWSTLAAGW